VAAAAFFARPALARAQDGGINRPLAFVPVTAAPLVTHTSSQRAEAILMFPSLVPLRKLTGRSDVPEWMLYAWHHDTDKAHFHAWSAPAITGPYTALSPLSKPSSVTPGRYDQNHFTCGDMAWDPIGRRLVSSPHSRRRALNQGNGEACQDSFLMQSSDGVTWDWLDRDNHPRLVCGAPRSIDSVHNGYGRLLARCRRRARNE